MRETINYITISFQQFALPVSVPRQGLLDSPGKMSNYQNFSGVRPSSKFYTENIRKPTGHTIKPTEQDIQRGELVNILL